MEVEEDVCTMATLADGEGSSRSPLLMELNDFGGWAEGVWMDRWRREQQKAWRKQILEVQTLRQVRGSAGAVMCETWDLGIKWPLWLTLLLEGQVAVDMSVVCPQDVKKIMLKQARMVHWKRWAAKHEWQEFEGMSLAGAN